MTVGDPRDEVGGEVGDHTGTPAEPGPAPTFPSPSPARPTLTRNRRFVACATVAAAVLIVALVTARRSPDAPGALAPPTASLAEPRTTASSTTIIETTVVTEPATTTTTRKPRRVPTGPPGPLTGTPVDLPGYEKRPALVVKIDNYDPDARPQSGLSLADVIYEEKVEGPLSRFAAVFHGADADQIGPVRSARSTDVQIIGPMNHPLFAYSGANGGFQALLAGSALTDVGAGSRKGGAYWRGGDKAMPHNLYTNTALLYAGESGVAPGPLWPFRGEKEPPGPGATQAVAAYYHFGGGITAVNWRWDTTEGGWVRTQNGSIHYDTDNWPVTVQNLVIQYVPYVDSDTTTTDGQPVPEAGLGGTGRGWVLTGGAAIPTVWARWGLESPTFYAGPDGELIKFAPGRTWVALVPVEYPATISFANGTTTG